MSRSFRRTNAPMSPARHDHSEATRSESRITTSDTGHSRIRIQSIPCPVLLFTRPAATDSPQVSRFTTRLRSGFVSGSLTDDIECQQSLGRGATGCSNRSEPYECEPFLPRQGRGHGADEASTHARHLPRGFTSAFNAPEVDEVVLHPIGPNHVDIRKLDRHHQG